MLGTRLYVLLTGLLFAVSAWAQEAVDWLARMSAALQNLDYHGELVYTHGGQIESLRIYHAVDPDGTRERLVTLNGTSREIVRGGGQVTCIGTGLRPVVYRDSAAARPALLSAFAVADPQRLTAHYSLALGGNERVAGLPTQLLEVKPRDSYRYGYRLWLEQESGMLLKSLRFGADGRSVEQLMFTRIALRERPSDRDLAPSSARADAAPAATLSLPQPHSGRASLWAVAEPPAGFALTLQQPLAATEYEHLIYSDGLTSVSVYIEPLTRSVPAFSGVSSRGALHLYGRVLDGHQITVLGDVPAATVERFAQGVVLTNGG